MSESTDTEIPAKKSKDSEVIKKPVRPDKKADPEEADHGKQTIKTPRTVKKNESKLDLKRKIDLNASDDFLPPPKLEPIYPEEEEEAGDDDASGVETDEDDYEVEETYTLTEWFPPDFWRSKLEESTKQVSISKLGGGGGENIADGEDEEYFYHLLKAKMTEAEKVLVTDVTVNNSTVSFKVN